MFVAGVELEEYFSKFGFSVLGFFSELFFHIAAFTVFGDDVAVIDSFV